MGQELDDELKDFIYKEGIQEAGNIGAGNASKYLSELIGEKVNISVPDISLIDISEAKEKTSSATCNRLNVSVNIESLNGSIALSMEKESYNKFIKMVGTQKENSKIKTMMNIAEHIARFYLDAVAEFLSIDLKFGQGKLLYMTKESLLMYLISKTNQKQKSNKGLVISTSFNIPNKVEGDILMIMGKKEIKQISEALEKIS